MLFVSSNIQGSSFFLFKVVRLFFVCVTSSWNVHDIAERQVHSYHSVLLQRVVGMSVQYIVALSAIVVALITDCLCLSSTYRPLPIDTCRFYTRLGRLLQVTVMDDAPDINQIKTKKDGEKIVWPYTARQPPSTAGESKFGCGCRQRVCLG